MHKHVAPLARHAFFFMISFDTLIMVSLCWGALVVESGIVSRISIGSLHFVELVERLLPPHAAIHVML